MRNSCWCASYSSTGSFDGKGKYGGGYSLDICWGVLADEKTYTGIEGKKGMPTANHHRLERYLSPVPQHHGTTAGISKTSVTTKGGGTSPSSPICIFHIAGDYIRQPFPAAAHEGT